MDGERKVGGLWCGDVLGRLSDYLDDELPQADRSAVDEHLRGCDWCRRFGGEVAATIDGLRGALPAEAPAADDQLARLLDEL